MSKVSHLNHILDGLPRATYFLAKFKEDDHKLHLNHRSCPTSSPENSCVKVQPTDVAWQSMTV